MPAAQPKEAYFLGPRDIALSHPEVLAYFHPLERQFLQSALPTLRAYVGVGEPGGEARFPGDFSRLGPHAAATGKTRSRREGILAHELDHLLQIAASRRNLEAEQEMGTALQRFLGSYFGDPEFRQAANRAHPRIGLELELRGPAETARGVGYTPWPALLEYLATVREGLSRLGSDAPFGAAPVTSHVDPDIGEDLSLLALDNIRRQLAGP